jgi:hypothetical protein
MILGGGEVDQIYATCYVYIFMFFQSIQAFFTLDRFGQQADRNIAPGGMFFYVFKVSRAAYVNRVRDSASKRQELARGTPTFCHF